MTDSTVTVAKVKPHTHREEVASQSAIDIPESTDPINILQSENRFKTSQAG